MPSSFKRRIPARPAEAQPAAEGAAATGSVHTQAASPASSEASQQPDPARTQSQGSSIWDQRYTLPAPPKLPLPAGLKIPLFSSPVPLLSTGVPALDDLLSGAGLQCGSVFLLVPTTGTHPRPPTTGPPEELDSLALYAAEGYVELAAKYGVAQGLWAGHTNLVIGDGAETLVEGLMQRIGEGEAGSESAGTPASTAAKLSSLSLQENNAGAAAKDAGLKIAFRYENMPRLGSALDSTRSAPLSGAAMASAEKAAQAHEQSKFCAHFDLSKRTPPAVLQAARAEGLLLAVELDDLELEAGEDVWSATLRSIRAHAEALRRKSTTAQVLRITLRGLGSEGWARSQSSQLSTAGILRTSIRMQGFLQQLRGIAREFTLPADGGVPLYIVATATLSAHLLASLPRAMQASPHGHDTIARCLHYADAAISFSSFSASSMLSEAFPGYTGSVHVLVTPQIGTLVDVSVKSSILRGMSSLGDSAGGGGENNLAFKVKRKRLVIETLHLDVGEDTKKDKPTRPASSAVSPAQQQGRDSGVARQPQGSPRTSAPPPAAPPDPPSIPPSRTRAEPNATPKPAFGGLQALRNRGLQVQKQQQQQQQAHEPQVRIQGSAPDEPAPRSRGHVHRTLPDAKSLDF